MFTLAHASAGAGFAPIAAMFPGVIQGAVDARPPRYHRDSVDSSSHAALSFPVRIERDEARALAKRARIFDRDSRAKGERNGALGHIGVEVLEFLAELVNPLTGLLCPSYTYLAKELNRSVASVFKSIQALVAKGFLRKLRRTEPTDIAPGEFGPRVHQTSNSYAFCLQTPRLLTDRPRPRRTVNVVQIEDEDGNVELVDAHDDFVVEAVARVTLDPTDEDDREIEIEVVDEIAEADDPLGIKAQIARPGSQSLTDILAAMAKHVARKAKADADALALQRFHSPG